MESEKGFPQLTRAASWLGAPGSTPPAAHRPAGQLGVEASLVGHREHLDDQMAPERRPALRSMAAKEQVAGEERQVRDQRPPVPARLFLALRQVEPDALAGEVAGQPFLLPAAHVGHPPGVLGKGQLEQVGGIQIGFAFEDRHVGYSSPGSAKLLQNRGVGGKEGASCNHHRGKNSTRFSSGGLFEPGGQG